MKLSKRSTLNQAIDVWWECHVGNWCPNSVRIYTAAMGSLREAMGHRRIWSIDRDDIRVVMERMLKERSSNGVRHHLHKWKGVFNWLWEDGLIPINPVQFRRLPYLPHTQVNRVPFTMEEKDRLITFLANPPKNQGPQFYPFMTTAILIAYHTGLRISDVAAVCWENNEEDTASYVDFQNEIIIARPHKLRRRNQRLEIPMDAELTTHLQQIYPDRYDGLPWVMPYMHQLQYSPLETKIRQQFRRILRAVGIDPTNHSFHSFRHGFVSRLLNAGVDPMIIGTMTGHSTHDIMRRYFHVTRDAKVAALAQVRKALQDARLHEMSLAAKAPNTP